MRRPTDADQESLDLLMAIGDMHENNELFLESLYDRKTWSAKQCKWFDDLCERYL